MITLRDSGLGHNLVTQCLTDILKRSLNTFNNQPIGSFNVYYNPCFLTGPAD